MTKDKLFGCVWWIHIPASPRLIVRKTTNQMIQNAFVDSVVGPEATQNFAATQPNHVTVDIVVERTDPNRSSQAPPLTRNSVFPKPVVRKKQSIPPTGKEDIQKIKMLEFQVKKLQSYSCSYAWGTRNTIA